MGCDASSACRHRPSRADELPHSLGQALDAMAASKAVAGWFGPVFLEAYLRHKRSEVQHVAEWAVNELCNRLRSRGLLRVSRSETGRCLHPISLSGWRNREARREGPAMLLVCVRVLAIVSVALYLVPTGAHLFELAGKMALSPG